MRVLIMGAAGFIGSHLTRRLLERGGGGGLHQSNPCANRTIDWGTKKQFLSIGVDGTRNILDECTDKVERFVYMSSFAAYGFGPPLKGYDEYIPLVKTGLHYGDAKAEAEQIVGSFAAMGAMDTTVIRPANVTGPGSWARTTT